MEILDKILYVVKLISLTISTLLFSALILIIIRSRFIQDIWSLTFRWRNLWEPLEFDYEYYLQKFNEAYNLLNSDPQKAVKLALQLLEEYLEYLGYEGKNFKERIQQVPKEKLTFYDDLSNFIIPEKLEFNEAEDILKKIKFSFKELDLDFDKLQLSG